MTLDFSSPGEVKVGMVDYVKSMIDEFPEDVSGSSITSIASDGLYRVDPNSPKLSDAKAEQFHTTVAQGIFASKRARPDIQQCI